MGDHFIKDISRGVSTLTARELFAVFLPKHKTTCNKSKINVNKTPFNTHILRARSLNCGRWWIIPRPPEGAAPSKYRTDREYAFSTSVLLTIQEGAQRDIKGTNERKGYEKSTGAGYLSLIYLTSGTYFKGTL